MRRGSVVTLAGHRLNIILFHLPFREFRRLHDRAHRAQKRGHLEVVGLLATTNRRPGVLTLVFLRNLARVPGSWKVGRDQITTVRRRLRRGGLRVRGLFHSHPLTEATLGLRDRRNTPTGWVHLVYDVCGREPRLYGIRQRKGRRSVEQLALSVERSRKASPLSESRLTATAPDGGRVRTS